VRINFCKKQVDKLHFVLKDCNFTVAYRWKMKEKYYKNAEIS